MRDYLKHYASPYYDPVKAHQYYMENRKLKGRQSRSTSALNEVGKQKWADAKESIKEQKEYDKEEIKTDKEQRMAELKAQAAESRARIAEKLEKLNQVLAESREERQENVTEAAINKIDQMKEQLKDRRAISGTYMRDVVMKDIQKIQKDAAKERDQISEETNTEQNKNKADADSERTKVANDLRAACATAFSEYKKAREALDGKTEEDYQNAYDAIKRDYGAERKSSSSSSSSSSSGKTGKGGKEGMEEATGENSTSTKKKEETTKKRITFDAKKIGKEAAERTKRK